VADGLTEDTLLEAFHRDYADEQFVQVLPDGQFPSTGQVAGANTVRIGATVDRRSGQVTVISAIDNLVKGTAGAAVQSINIALGLPETSGLTRTALAP
jgi:N-acetyl-gamma-glutamyl-phosphate reductase